MSGIIFVALALGWAVYLIPKALQRNEELARTRSVVTFSDRMRVLGSGDPATQTGPTSEADPAAGAPGPRTAVRATSSSPTAPLAPRPLITRTAARRAAKRRRVVLALLVFALGMVSSLAWFAIVAVWAPAVPGSLILAFLVVARLSVRGQARHRVAVPGAGPAQAGENLTDSTDPASEDTAGIDLRELATSPSDPEVTALADEGSLWDPLPVTLPTYVTKPTARRTVRTIELTAGPITSSGHSAADSKLVKQVEAAKKAQASEEEAKNGGAAGTEQRKVAGA